MIYIYLLYIIWIVNSTLSRNKKIFVWFRDYHYSYSSQKLQYCWNIDCANTCLSGHNELLSQSDPLCPTYQDCSQLITAQQRHSHQHTLNIIINISHSRSINDKNYTASHTYRTDIIISDYFSMAPWAKCKYNEPPWSL